MCDCDKSVPFEDPGTDERLDAEGPVRNHCQESEGSIDLTLTRSRTKDILVTQEAVVERGGFATIRVVKGPSLTDEVPRVTLKELLDDRFPGFLVCAPQPLASSLLFQCQ